ncbi:MAG: hypothetical protein HKP09_06090 [Enterobacterales bacterium]|nr:hypothetical protein [Enterobacterales bacterium]
MFNPISVPFDCVMLYNVIKLKPEFTMDDAELTIGEMCNAVKNNYAEDGFIAGQVFEFTGFISDEGSVNTDSQKTDAHIAIITYWESFEQHERSHADELFKKHFGELVEMSDDAYEIGYRMLWQGVPEDE